MSALGVMFVTTEAGGAWPNGSTVAKVNSQPDNATENGALATILGSIDVRDQGGPARFAYFLEWASRPGLPIFVVDTNNDGTPRLKLAEPLQ